MIKYKASYYKICLTSLIYLCLSSSIFCTDNTSDIVNKNNLELKNQQSAFRIANLQSLLETARNNNNKLKQLKMDSKLSIYDEYMAMSKFFPTIDANMTFTYQLNPLDPIVIRKGQLGEQGGVFMPNEDITVYKGMENTYYDYSFTLQQPLVTWGKILNGYRIQRHISTISKLKEQEFQVELINKLSICYYSLYYLNKLKLIISEQQTAAKRLLELSSINLKNGVITETQFLQSKIADQEVRLGTVELNNQYSNLLLTIIIDTGLDENTPVEFIFEDIKNNDDNIINEYKNETFEVLKERSIVNNTQLKQLRKVSEIQKIKKFINIFSLYGIPDIFFHTKASITGPRAPFIEKGWYGKNEMDLNISIIFQTRLIDGGTRMLELLKQMEDKKKYEQSYKIAIDQISNLISETRLKMDLNKTKTEYFKSKIELLASSINEQLILIENGSGNEIEYIKKQMELNNERIKFYKELIDFQTNYFLLRAITSEL